MALARVLRAADGTRVFVTVSGFFLIRRQTGLRLGLGLGLRLGQGRERRVLVGRQLAVLARHCHGGITATAAAGQQQDGGQRQPEGNLLHIQFHLFKSSWWFGYDGGMSEKEDAEAAMSPPSLASGDVVQLGPEVGNRAFAYSFMTVTELHLWGVQGYVQVLGTREDGPGGQAYYRAKWGEFERIGKAEWWVP